MAKSVRELSALIAKVDAAAELVDARIPVSGRNPMLDELLKKKPRVVVLTKADLADADQTKQWIAHFRNMGIYAFACNSKSGEGCNRLRAELNAVLREKLQRRSERGLAALSALQEPNGAYLSWDEENSESVCQVIVALTELGISLDDERFVKNGQTLPQVLERFACEDGSYRHSLNGNSDEMATEQAFYALAAIHRAETGKTTLYDMTDVMQ